MKARCALLEQQLAQQQKINTAVEALTRMENVNLDEKPAVKYPRDGGWR